MRGTLSSIYFLWKGMRGTLSSTYFLWKGMRGTLSSTYFPFIVSPQKWTKVGPPSKDSLWPKGRDGHASTTIHSRGKSYVVIDGGWDSNSDPINDTWMLDTADFSWHQVCFPLLLLPPPSHPPSPLHPSPFPSISSSPSPSPLPLAQNLSQFPYLSLAYLLALI